MVKDVMTADDQNDWEWGGALEVLEQFENPLGILELLANGALVPDWVRPEIKAWLKDERPPWPKKDETDEDRKLREAAEACRDKVNWRTGEELGDRESGRIRRIAEERGIDPVSLENYYNGKGRAYSRGTPSRKWERVYLPGIPFDKLP
jgi:hypothetical protein